MLLLLNLARRYWRESSIAVLVVAVVVVVAGWMHDRRDLERARLVYLHPQKRSVEKLVTVTGPVKIVTHTIEKPGETVTVIVEDRGAVVESSGSEVTSTPVPLAVAMAPPRTDRWLLGALVDDARFSDTKGYTGLAGYSFRNRMDLMAGGGAEGFKLLAVVRF